MTAFIEQTSELRPARHHALLIDTLEAVERGDIKRLMVFMPPGSAKSTYANIMFSAWFMGRNPKKTIITASYGQELADKWGRRSRNLVGSDEYREIFGFGLSGDNTAANRWANEKGGEYATFGVGGPVTGNRADLVIIDDPVKGREEADSETIREKTKDWYKNDLWTRMKPGAAVILIMTRWHEDDLAGWLLEEQKHGGEQWSVLSLPWEAKANDPLGRPVGERLWPEWFTAEMEKEARRDPRRWSALYQQEPAPDEGDYFRVDWFKTYERRPEYMRVYGASDYAVTADGGDFTVHIVVGVDPNGLMHVLDLWRGQTASDEWIEAFCDLVERWKPLEWAEEGGQIKAALGPFITRRQLERKVHVYRRPFAARTDKAVRAQSIRGRMAMQGLYLPMEANWVPEFRRELLAFPAAKHDDQVDALGLIGQLLDHIYAAEPPRPSPEDSINALPKLVVGGQSNMTIDQLWAAHKRKKETRI